MFWIYLGTSNELLAQVGREGQESLHNLAAGAGRLQRVISQPLRTVTEK